MKVICIKSYNTPCGHATINHISGNVYELRELLDGNFTIINDHNDLTKYPQQCFKSVSSIREEKLISLGI